MKCINKRGIMVLLFGLIILSGCNNYPDTYSPLTSEMFCFSELGENWHSSYSRELGNYCYSINDLGGREIRDIDNVGLSHDEWILLEKEVGK